MNSIDVLEVAEPSQESLEEASLTEYEALELNENELLDNFEADPFPDIDDYQGFDVDHNEVTLDGLTADQGENKVRRFESIEDIKDRDVLIREAAMRIGIRKGLPMVYSVFGTTASCQEFFDEALQESPPPTSGMLDAATKIFNVGDNIGLAVLSMDKCQKYLISKNESLQIKPETKKRAEIISDWLNLPIPKIAMTSEKTLLEWIEENGK